MTKFHYHPPFKLVSCIALATAAILAVVGCLLLRECQLAGTPRNDEGIRFLRRNLTTPTVELPRPGLRPTWHYMNFTAVAVSHQPVTDKVAHGYGTIYDAYFTEPVVLKPTKLLEIGVGCGMGYGPGASSKIWPDLFPRAEIWFAEYNVECIKKYWQPGLSWRYVTGDQSDIKTLQMWTATFGGNFDFIIDDGGHTNPQIWNSFHWLFGNALKPGGTYFIEDIHVGRVEPWYAGGIPGGNGTVILDAIKDWLDQLVVRSALDSGVRKPSYRHILPDTIARIDCVRDMCAITKTGA
jgi:hypothetical protein